MGPTNKNTHTVQRVSEKISVIFSFNQILKKMQRNNAIWNDLMTLQWIEKPQKSFF